MLQREADRNDYRKTDDGTSTVTTSKTKNYVTRPRSVEERLSSVSVLPRCGRARGNCRPGTQASGKVTIFAHARCFDRRRDKEIVDVAFAFSSPGLRDFALSMFFRTPLRRGLLVSQVVVRMRWIARRRVCAESFWLANANVI
jgi:hypothetical protein